MGRLNYAKLAPAAIQAMRGVETYVRQSGLETPLLELVRLRASQINGCAYCIDMHTKDARAGGETEQRLYCLSVWRETSFYTEREQAALAWTEAVTNVSKAPIEDELYEHVLKSFPEKQLVDLTMAVIAINSWNRLAIPFQSAPGHYQPPVHRAE
jgi:AhpD family alkylhydroperoxidase